MKIPLSVVLIFTFQFKSDEENIWDKKNHSITNVSELRILIDECFPPYVMFIYEEAI